MKMLRAVVRRERIGDVADSLERSGFPAMTRVDAMGRGREGGIKVGDAVYRDLPKALVMVVVEDGEAAEAADAVWSAARTGDPGDGRVFVTPVETAYTIRTGEEML